LIVYDRPDLMTIWVEEGIYGFSRGYDGETKAIGYTIDDKLVAAVTYSKFESRQDGSFFNLEMGVFSVDKRWCNRQYLKAVFAYPFIQLGLERVQTVCSAQEEGVVMFNKRLGFKQEGTHRKAWVTGCDALSWSMLREECKWL
jgi:RimJ/RimL family protein N-acetyltransferase